MPTLHLRPGLCPGPTTGGAYDAPPDPLAGKGGGAPEGGTPGKWRGRKRRGGEGENCCHQMSDFMAKMRGRTM